MSLYAMMGGGSPMVPMLFKILDNEGGFAPPRPRDAWLEDEGRAIVVLTRTGGGNRPNYAGENDAMREHPSYISDGDDDFDGTFARWRFHAPQKLRPLLADVHRLMYAGQRFGVKPTMDNALLSLGRPDSPGTAEPDVGVRIPPKDDPAREELSGLLGRLYEAVMGGPAS